MALKYRSKVVQLKPESAYGTPVVPTDTDALLLSNVEIRAIEAEEVERENIKPTYGNDPSVLANKRVVITAECELAGSSALGTPPPWGQAARACGYAETIVTDTSVTYNPISTGQESATMVYTDEQAIHQVVGVRGDLGIVFEGANFPRLRLAMTGIFQDPTAGSLPTPDFSAWQQPLIRSKANTTANLNSVEVNMAALEIASNNAVIMRDLTRDQEVILGDRRMTGRLSMDADPLATLNVFQLITGRAQVPLQVLHGPAGNRVQIDCPAVQLAAPGKPELDTALGTDVELRILPTGAGNNEVTLAVL